MDLSREILSKYLRSNNDFKARDIIKIYYEKLHVEPKSTLPESFKSWQFTDDRFIFSIVNDSIKLTMTTQEEIERNGKEGIEHILRYETSWDLKELGKQTKKEDIYKQIEITPYNEKNENTQSREVFLTDFNSSLFEERKNNHPLKLDKDLTHEERRMLNNIYRGKIKILSEMGIESSRIYVPSNQTITKLLKEKNTSKIVLPGLMHTPEDGLNFIAGYVDIEHKHKLYEPFHIKS